MDELDEPSDISRYQVTWNMARNQPYVYLYDRCLDVELNCTLEQAVRMRDCLDYCIRDALIRNEVKDED